MNKLDNTSYSISQVETMTGISSHTLRVWERRYDLLKPQRTDTNIRYYTDSQFKKLLNISVLLKLGYKISKINAMSTEEIHALVVNSILDVEGTSSEDIQLLVISMMEMDESIFTKVFDRNIQRFGLTETMLKLIYPFLSQVGVLWGVDRAMPAQEHFISNFIRQKLIVAIDILNEPALSAPKVVLFLPPEDTHEIGLLLAYFMFKDAGFKVYYLGGRVPLEDVFRVSKMVDSAFLFTLLISPGQKIEGLKDLQEQLGIPMFLSGNPKYFDENFVNNGMTYIPKAQDLKDKIHELLTQ